MAISFKTLSYIYSKGQPFEHKALDDINLDITEGKITALIGETGSGKSTLVQHLNALLLPSSGSLEILDHTITPEKNKNLKALRKDVGLVFQFSEYQLFEETILKDVAFGPKNFGDDEDTAIKKAIQALSLVGISKEYFNVSPLEISGGQKRRVAIAGILALGPKIVVLDEPTAGLDPAGSKEIINLFVELNKKYKTTIIIVSHDNEMVYNYADEVVLLSKGHVIYHGDTLDFFEDNELLEKNDILKPQLIDFKHSLINQGFKISKTSRTLEEVVKELHRQVK